jgi:energy-coupling factor transport system permease protein
MKSYFAAYHPTVNFLYFFLILSYSMTFTHPLCRLFSLLGACSWSLYLTGRRALRFQLKIILPMMLMAAIVNPAFSHEGITILAYLPSNNPLTLESICYGLSMTIMLASVIIWFSCYHETMSSDKFVYLFGQLVPAMSLMISMTLRFVPRFQVQLKTITNAQNGIGRGMSCGTIWQRINRASRILSIMVTWSLENAIETADSMKSRGYGGKKRTAFSIYRFDRRDRMAVFIIAGMGIMILLTTIHGDFCWRYYPALHGTEISPSSILAFFCYFALCLFPLFIEKWEDRKWNSIALKT